MVLFVILLWMYGYVVVYDGEVVVVKWCVVVCVVVVVCG